MGSRNSVRTNARTGRAALTHASLGTLGINGYQASARPRLKSRSETDIRCEERSRIGRELHDSTSQWLVALQLHLSSLKKKLVRNRLAPQFQQLESTIGELHSAIRAISATGVASGGLPQSLPVALQALVADFAELTGLDVRLQLRNYRQQPSDVELTLYRIVQEALANIASHAKATRAIIRIATVASRLRLSIQDDGVGITDPGHSSGRGLANMRYRVAQLGGLLAVEALSCGLRLSFTIAIVGDTAKKADSSPTGQQ
jgi:signal transduction histidine kinase